MEGNSPPANQFLLNLNGTDPQRSGLVHDGGDGRPDAATRRAACVLSVADWCAQLAGSCPNVFYASIPRMPESCPR